MTSLVTLGNNKRAFTIIEALIVLGVSTILVAGVAGAIGRFGTTARLDTETDQLIQVLRTAQVQSKARLNSSAHGVYFSTATDPDFYTLYQGGTYATRNSDYDRVYELPPALSLLSTLGSNDIQFAPGFGTVTATGTVTIVYEGVGSQSVTLNSFGLVERSE